MKVETLNAIGTAAGPVHGQMIPGLFWAFRIHADGRAEALNVDAPIELRGDGLLWLHFNLADSRSVQWIHAANLDVSEAAKSLLVSKDTFQQIHTSDDAMYGVISDLLRAIDSETEETGYLHFVMTEQYLVSGRLHALCAVDATRRVLEDWYDCHLAAVKYMRGRFGPATALHSAPATSRHEIGHGPRNEVVAR